MASQIKSAGLGQSIAKLYAIVPWTTPTYIYTSNNSYAIALFNADEMEDTSVWLRSTTYGFTIPAGATIDGIKVEVEKKAQANSKIVDFQAKIVKAGAETGDNKLNPNFWTTTDAYRSYGGATDKWGKTWTPAQINASNFGFSISASMNYPSGICRAYVDHIRITVYYTEVALTNTKINIGDVFKDVDEIKINIGDSWKTVTKIQINIGDVWKTIFG